MDRSGCDLVEVVPVKVSGVPLVIGTRIPADTILDYVDSFIRRIHRTHAAS